MNADSSFQDDRAEIEKEISAIMESFVDKWGFVMGVSADLGVQIIEVQGGGKESYIQKKNLFHLTLSA